MFPVTLPVNGPIKLVLAVITVPVTVEGVVAPMGVLSTVPPIIDIVEPIFTAPVVVRLFIVAVPPIVAFAVVAMLSAKMESMFPIPSTYKSLNWREPEPRSTVFVILGVITLVEGIRTISDH